MAQSSSVSPLTPEQVSTRIRIAFTESVETKSSLSGLEWFRCKLSYFWNTPPVWKKGGTRASALLENMKKDFAVPDADLEKIGRKYSRILAVAGEKVYSTFKEMMPKAPAWQLLQDTKWKNSQNIFTFLEGSSLSTRYNLLRQKLQELRLQADAAAPGNASLARFHFRLLATQFLGNWRLDQKDDELKNLSLWDLDDPQHRQMILDDALEFFYPGGEATPPAGWTLLVSPGVDLSKNIFLTILEMKKGGRVTDSDPMGRLFNVLQKNCDAAKVKSGTDAKRAKDIFINAFSHVKKIPQLATFWGLDSPVVEKRLCDDAVQFFFRTAQLTIGKKP